jgi:phosphohistidine swiveling domain-containing protein
VTHETNSQIWSDPVHEEGAPGHFWTRTNAGEASPGVLTPLAWTLWRDQLELAMRQAFCDIGLLDPGDVHVVTITDERMVGCFYGRAAANVDHVRAYFERIPNTSGAEWEDKMQGSRRDVGVSGSGGSTQMGNQVSERWEQLRAETPGALSALRAEQHAWWLRSVATSDREGAHERFAEAVERFRNAMRLHARQRYLLQSAHSQVANLVNMLDRPDLEMVLMSGYGGMEETQVGIDLWRVSRDELTIAEFLVQHGYHGPGEGAIHNRSWREDSRHLDLTAHRYRELDDEHHPARRAERVHEARACAEQEVLAGLDLEAQAQAVEIWSYVRQGVVATTIGKAAFLMAIDAARAAARILGQQWTDQGVLERSEDIFFLTVDEVLGQHLPPWVNELVAFRRDRHAEYLRIALPESWMSPAPAVRVDERNDDNLEVDVFVGTPASPGQAQGPARVITDPSEQDVQTGEVLVAEVTDPSWVAAMILAEGLVVDVGGTASHAAIVARELGVPCIVNTRNGTRRVRTGDVVRMDGETGTIEILERAQT